MRLIIVSNRLPTIVVQEQGQWQFKGTAGGLTSGLSAWLTRRRQGGDADSAVWVGWPGTTVPAEEEETVRRLLWDKDQACPVFLSQKAMDGFYLGFCNSTIWPLFHYFPTFVHFNADQWEEYQEVNRSFFNTLQDLLQPGDQVWIHDYHLLLLPTLLRQKFPSLSIGFFLHIPFPTFEVFRLLPGTWRRALLEGILGADLVGFHTHDYSEDFTRSVRRLLGYDTFLGTVTVDGRRVRVDTFPMGIDYKLYSELLLKPEVRAQAAQDKASLAGLRTVLSVDRLDYSKGIPSRLRGFSRFLELYPQWHGQVCLSMVVVPSRIGVDRYDEMKHQIDEMVGDINGRYGTVGWVPIRYQYRMLSSVPLTALYSISDVALVTPLRDGMNLVAKEYLACRQDDTGVLVLSEMAGAAAELGEALIVNPNAPDEIAQALSQALDMPVEEQKLRNRAMRVRIAEHDVNWWASDFLRALNDISQAQEHEAQVRLTAAPRNALLQAWSGASSRLLLLDYDGTLVPRYARPDMAAPGPRLLTLLQTLAQRPDTHVAIISGRPRAELDAWFGALPLDIAAEHGVWLRDRLGAWVEVAGLDSEWKKMVRPWLDSAAERLAGAFVEEKEYALVWHHGNTDVELGQARARQLREALTSLVANANVKVIAGHSIVEVRSSQIHKGAIAGALVARCPADFVLAVGDDVSDEDMFRGLPTSAWTVKVGPELSCARYALPGPNAVTSLLEEMASAPLAAAAGALAEVAATRPG